MRFLSWLATALVLLPSLASAWLELPSFMSSHMVIDRHHVRIDGVADESSTIVIYVDNNMVDKVVTPSCGEPACWFSYQTNAVWPPGGPHTITVENANLGDKVVLDDVLFGTNLVCHGQSNMEFSNIQILDPTEIINKTYPNMRLFTVNGTYSRTPVENVTSYLGTTRWTPAEPLYLSTGKPWTIFSALCTLTGIELQHRLQEPVGLVAAYWGGTPIQAWSGADAVKECPFASDINQGNGPQTEYSTLYNGMLYPLRRLGVSAFVCRQGEYEAETGLAAIRDYECRFPAFVRGLRTLFNNPDMPVVYASLAPAGPSPGDGGMYAHQREAQRVAASLPRVSMTTSMDLGDPTCPVSNHPRHKRPSGKRLGIELAHWLLNTAERGFGPDPVGLVHDAAQGTITVEYGEAVALVKTLSYSFPYTDEPCPADRSPFELQYRGIYIALPATVEGSRVVLRAPDDLVALDPATYAPLRYAFADGPYCATVDARGEPVRPWTRLVEVQVRAPPVRTFLFLDDHAVRYHAGTTRWLEPLRNTPALETVLSPQHDWERYLSYASMYVINGTFRLWYQCCPLGETCFLCHATSGDGVSFHRPPLPDGSNRVYGGRDDYYGAAVLYEPDTPRPFKLAHWGRPNGVPGMYLAFSHDGLHWTPAPGGPVIKGAYSGTTQNAPPFADQHPETQEIDGGWYLELAESDVVNLLRTPNGTYRSYHKTWIDGPDGQVFWKRAVGVTESRDFTTWDQDRRVLSAWPDERDDPATAYLPGEGSVGTELHGGPAMYHARSRTYLMLLQRLNWASTPPGRLDSELAVSHGDGLRFDRIFRPEDGQPLWMNGTKFNAGCLWTNARPMHFLGATALPETRFYYGSYSSWDPLPGHTGVTTRVGAGTMVRDRFAYIAQLNAKYPAQLTMKPIDLTRVAAVSLNANGSVSIELLDARGYRIRAYPKQSIAGDDVRIAVPWNLTAAQGLYSFRLHLSDGARLYALHLEGTPH